MKDLIIQDNEKMVKTNLTKEEAMQMLQKCGILDSNGEISDPYKDILTPKTVKSHKTTGYERVDDNQVFYYDVGGATGSDYDKHGDGEIEAMYEAANYYSNFDVVFDNARADKLMRQLRRFAVEHREKKLDWNNSQIPKYIIRFGYYKKELVVCREFYGRDFGNIFFDSEKNARLAIDAFHDELIWYFTEYKDSL